MLVPPYRIKVSQANDIKVYLLYIFMYINTSSSLVHYWSIPHLTRQRKFYSGDHAVLSQMLLNPHRL